MKLFLNLTAGKLVTSATDSTPLGELVVKQNDIDNLELVLLTETGNVSSPFNIIGLPSPFTNINVGARTKSNVMEDDLLFSAADFAVSGTGDTTVYTADFNLETTSIAAKFPDENTTLLSVEALLDIELSNADGSVKRSFIDQWPTRVNRDIFRGTEGVPANANPLTRAAWRADITDLTGGTATALDGIATEGKLAIGALLVIPDLDVANAVQCWKLVETAPAVERDVVGAGGATSFTMNSAGLTAGMLVAGYDFAPGTTIASITSPGGSATVTMSTAKLSSGTAPTAFYTVSATQIPPIDVDPDGLSGVWIAQQVGEKEFVAASHVWTGEQQFNDGNLVLAGTTSGYSTLKAPATGGGTSTLPSGTSTLAPQGYALFTDTKAAGSNGDAVTTGAWRDLTLNTEAADTLGLFSVSGNVITVAAGAAGQTWEVDFVVPCYNTSSSQVRLYRTSGTPATLLTSSIIYSWNSNYVTSNAIGRGAITFSGGETLKLQVQTQTNGNIGYNSLNTGEAVIFSAIRFRRLA